MHSFFLEQQSASQAGVTLFAGRTWEKFPPDFADRGTPVAGVLGAGQTRRASPPGSFAETPSMDGSITRGLVPSGLARKRRPLYTGL